jgi:hypothetical protein
LQTNEDLDNIIEEVDEDGSGTLDFDGKNDKSGLPDFSWYKIPKREKYTKLPRTIQNVAKI